MQQEFWHIEGHFSNDKMIIKESIYNSKLCLAYFCCQVESSIVQFVPGINIEQMSALKTSHQQLMSVFARLHDIPV